MKTHILKVKTKYITEIIAGLKRYEVRLDDRNYEVGDVIILSDYGCESALNDVYYQALCVIKSIQSEIGLVQGYISMDIRLTEWAILTRTSKTVSEGYEIEVANTKVMKL